MTTTKAEAVEDAPYYIGNVVNSTIKPVYLNKPKHLQEEPDTSNNPAPSITEGESVEDTQDKNPDPEKRGTDWEKRYSDLKSHHDKKVNALETKLDELVQKHLEATKAKEQDEPLPRTPEEVEEWAKRYPDLIDMIVTISGQQISKQTKALKQEQEHLRKVAEQTESQKSWAELLKAHPDAMDYLESGSQFQKFKTWYDEQPTAVQAMIADKNYKVVARGLDLFKRDTGVTSLAEKREKQKQDSMSVGTGGAGQPTSPKKIWTSSEVRKMRDKEYAKHEKEIELAMLEGRYRED